MTAFSWKTLKAPILVLAPMEDVTDTVFRRIIATIARPHVFFTEFTNVNGMFSQGATIVNQRLQYTEDERPLIAQIWGKDPDFFRKAAERLADLGFDGIDINMGCPERTVVKNGCGAALSASPNLAREIITATIEGARDLPVSVKTRIGVNTIVTDLWIPVLLSCPIAALTVHGRTAKEQSEVPAHWDEIGKAVQIRNQIAPHVRLLGNGDVKNYADAVEKCRMYGVDGVMIGRGIFHDPWAFAVNEYNASISERLELLTRHVRLFDEIWGKKKHFPILKKYFKIYVSGFDGASDLRVKLMACENRAEVEQVLQEVKHI